MAKNWQDRIVETINFIENTSVGHHDNKRAAIAALLREANITQATSDALSQGNNFAVTNRTNIQDLRSHRRAIILIQSELMGQPVAAAAMAVNTINNITLPATVITMELSPGFVPPRLSGYVFLRFPQSLSGNVLMDLPAEMEKVYLLLMSNPGYTRMRSFSKKRRTNRGSKLPPNSELKQFDQIMRETGLWNDITDMGVKTNHQSGIIKKEN